MTYLSLAGLLVAGAVFGFLAVLTCLGHDGEKGSRETGRDDGTRDGS